MPENASVAAIDQQQQLHSTGAAVPANGQTKDSFRNYDEGDRVEGVRRHYRLMRQNQTLAFANRMLDKYSFERPRAYMTVREAFKELENYVDCSDPDLGLPNPIHMFQTAEGIRRAGLPDWMQLLGLVHDVGKIMFLWGTPEDGQEGTATGDQWALGGDTWVVGCRIPDCAVYPEFNGINPDMQDDRYNTELGIYEAGCGMDKLTYAFGHDEYLYQLLIANGCPLPAEALAMARYHSLYPWHTGGAYRCFMTPKDQEVMQWVLEFNKFDLYTKDSAGLQRLGGPSEEELWGYYQPLIDKYMPGKLKW